MHTLGAAIADMRDYVSRVLGGPYVKREAAAELRRWLGTDLVKVIVGPRRAGKTWLTVTTLGQEAGYINFEDDRLEGHSPEEVFAAARAVFGERRVWILDEIQMLPRWELFVERLRRAGLDVVITGSNSRLLSRELSSVLTGRHADICVYPFSYREFLRARGADPAPHSLEEYLRSGGFPEVVVKGYDPYSYASMLLSDVLTKDVIFRYRPRYPDVVRDLADFLIRHSGSPISLRSILKGLDVGSLHTLKKYLGYLQEAFLILPLPPAFGRYWARGPLKYYPVDHSFLLAARGERMGQLLEAAVFVELKRQGLDVYYYRKGGVDCDFLVRVGQRYIPVQVSYRLDHGNIGRERACFRRLGKGALIALYNETDFPATNAVDFFTSPLRILGIQK